MQFEPKSEQELRSEMLLADGEYDFEVVQAEDKTSKKGNEMIALNMKLFAPNGSTPFVRDWLVSSDHPLCQMKIRHFCQSTSMMGEYDAGTLDAMVCQGATGRVKITSQQQEGYGAQNCVEDYVWDADQEPQKPMGVPAQQTQKANAAAAKRAESAGVAEDPEIPF